MNKNLLRMYCFKIHPFVKIDELQDAYVAYHGIGETGPQTSRKASPCEASFKIFAKKTSKRIKPLFERIHFIEMEQLISKQNL